MQFSVTLLLSFYLNFPFDFFKFKNDKATLFMSAIHRAFMQRVLLSSANLVKNISDFLVPICMYSAFRLTSHH